MWPGRPTYSIRFSNYPVNDLLMAFVYFYFFFFIIFFLFVVNFVIHWNMYHRAFLFLVYALTCVHAWVRVNVMHLLRVLRSACQLWTGKDQFFWCTLPQGVLACAVPEQDLQWFPFVQRTRVIHGWFSLDPRCLLHTVLACPSLPFPVCFFLFEMLFFAWLMP